MTTTGTTCPPGTAHVQRKVADPTADDQMIYDEDVCVLPDGTLHGPYEQRFGTTVKERGTYDHGRRTGRWITMGTPGGNGTWSYREGDYVDDHMEGAWTSYWAPGVIAWTGTFRADKREGRFEWFRADGTPEQAGELVDDLQDGTWTFWRPDGTVDHTEKWARGKRVRR